MDAGKATGIFGMVCLILTISFAISPFLYASNSLIGLEGTAGIMDRPWSLSHITYSLGDLFCHQDPSRSIVIDGNQMPICIRDLGIMVGLSMGLLVSCISDRLPRSRIAMVLTLLMCSVTVVEWAVEQFVQMPDVIRGLSGVVSGIGAGFLGSWMIHRVYEKG